jgi:hypothetical protein
VPHGVPRGILHGVINVLDKNVFQNPQILRRTHGLFPEQTTLATALSIKCIYKRLQSFSATLWLIACARMKAVRARPLLTLPHQQPGLMPGQTCLFPACGGGAGLPDSFSLLSQKFRSKLIIVVVVVASREFFLIVAAKAAG